MAGESLILHTQSGDETIHLSGATGSVRLTTPSAPNDKYSVSLEGQTGRLRLGLPDDILLGGQSPDDDRGIELNGQSATCVIGRRDKSGRVNVRDATGETSISLRGDAGLVTLGCAGVDGDLILENESGLESCRLNGAGAALHLGTQGLAGELLVYDGGGSDILRVHAESASMRVGSGTRGGNFYVQDGVGRKVIRLGGDAGEVAVGSSGHAGSMSVSNSAGVVTVRLDGESGDVLLSNADCAEEFDFVEQDVAKGSVVVIDDEERLTLSTSAYDRRVAGVVSGAGAFRPAIVLDRRPGAARPAIAMIGKVSCRVDATFGQIRSGDLLVSSSTPGHAMAARDPLLTPGAVLGKALRGLDEGTGLIPILVCLQ